MISQFSRGGIHEDSIDGEIASIGVGDFIAHLNVLGATAINIAAVGAETGHFNNATLVMHKDHAKTFTHAARLGKYGADLLGGRAGGDVVIGGRKIEQFIAHTTAREIRGESGRGKFRGDFRGGFARAEAWTT